MVSAEPKLRWSRLLAGAGLTARGEVAADPEITTVVEDSRQVRPGACFVALRGTRVDGHAFLAGALEAGAA